MRRIIIATFFYLASSCNLFSQNGIYVLGEVIASKNQTIIERKYPNKKLIADKGVKIQSGDKIHTKKNSSIIIKLYNKDTIYIEENSKIKINTPWNISHIAGVATYDINRENKYSLLEITADFIDTYALKSTFQIKAQKEKTIFVEKGTLTLQAYKKKYTYYNSDKNCREKPFIKKTDKIKLSQNETVAFISQNAIKSCSKPTHSLAKDDDAITLYYEKHNNNFICSAKTNQLEKNSEKTDISKTKNGCILKLESKKNFCLLLSTNNVIFTDYKVKEDTIHIQLLPLEKDEKAFVQYKCF